MFDNVILDSTESQTQSRFLGSNLDLSFSSAAMYSVVATLLVFGVTLVQAINHRVTVGTGGFVYNPNTVQAAAGDTVEFIVNGVRFISLFLEEGELIFRFRYIVSLKLLSRLRVFT